MGYEPKVGDMVEAIGDKTPGVIAEVFAEPRRVGASSVDVGRVTFTIGGGPYPMSFGSFSGTLSVAPRLPDAVGQRVRAHDGRKATIALMDCGRPYIEWDDLPGQTHGFIADALVRIADKAEPGVVQRAVIGTPPPLRAKPDKTFAERKAERVAEWLPTNLDAWPNRPQCGRPGHDPACRCDVGWVRQPEPEPDGVHEMRTFRGVTLDVGAPGIHPAAERVWRAFGVKGGRYIAVDHPTREGAVALWRARHG